jgi:uncharacterized protein (TIGR03905 family)
MTYSYRTHGTCSAEIIVDLEDDIVRSVRVIGGCSGNLQGISSLVQGMKAEEVIAKLKGIRCGTKPTSCPDQIAAALEKARVLQKKA